MTTNRPEKLDEALIRPGRIDHQVAFGNASRTQIRELFERMYSNDLPRTKFVKSISTTAPIANGKLASIKEKEDVLNPEKINGTLAPVANGSAVSSDPYSKINESMVIGEKDNGEVGEAELRRIAREFSFKVPDNMFSPAEIQGFLLKRKKDPRKALENVGKWVEGMAEVKRKGSKVVKVQ